MEQVLPRVDRRIPASQKWALAAAGGLSLLWGLKRRGLFGSLASLAGVELLTYGISGHHTHELVGLGRKARDSNGRIPFQAGIQVEHAVSINAPVDQVYQYFRDFENFPFFMKHIENVEVQDATHSHWSARGPLGTTVEWDAEIISDEPNKLISWRSVNSPDIESAGSVHFKELPAGRGTTMRVELQYLPPAGALGAVIARLFGEEPELQIKDDLRRFKQRVETGEIATTKGQPRGPEVSGRDSREPRPEPHSDRSEARRSKNQEPRHPETESSQPARERARVASAGSFD